MKQRNNTDMQVHTDKPVGPQTGRLCCCCCGYNSPPPPPHTPLTPVHKMSLSLGHRGGSMMCHDRMAMLARVFVVSPSRLWERFSCCCMVLLSLSSHTLDMACKPRGVYRCIMPTLGSRADPLWSARCMAECQKTLNGGYFFQSPHTCASPSRISVA